MLTRFDICRPATHDAADDSTARRIETLNGCLRACGDFSGGAVKALAWFKSDHLGCCEVCHRAAVDDRGAVVAGVLGNGVTGQLDLEDRAIRTLDELDLGLACRLRPTMYGCA